MPIDTYPPQNVTAQTPVLGYAPVTAFTGFSNTAGGIAFITTEIDICSVTVTVPAGRRIRISAQFSAVSTVSNDEVRMQLKEGASYLQTVPHGMLANVMETFVGSVILSPTAGTHTYTLRINRQSGTGNVQYYNDAAQLPVFLMVEDITGSQLPVLPQSVPVGALAYAEVQATQSTF